jgi:hypothetical protein
MLVFPHDRPHEAAIIRCSRGQLLQAQLSASEAHLAVRVDWPLAAFFRTFLAGEQNMTLDKAGR